MLGCEKNGKCCSCNNFFFRDIATLISFFTSALTIHGEYMKERRQWWTKRKSWKWNDLYVKRFFRIFPTFSRFKRFSSSWIFILCLARPSLYPQPSCQEFIIISFWYFKQWKSNINLIKIINVFPISFGFFLFLPFNNGEIITNNKIVKSNKERRTATK